MAIIVIRDSFARMQGQSRSFELLLSLICCSDETAVFTFFTSLGFENLASVLEMSTAKNVYLLKRFSGKEKRFLVEDQGQDRSKISSFRFVNFENFLFNTLIMRDT